MKRSFTAVLLMTLWVFHASGAYGYEGMEIKDGATLKGTVHFKGPLPADEKVTLDNDMDYCGKEQPLVKYAGVNSGAKNAVVWIDQIEKGKTLPEKSVKVTLRNCRAEPLVSVGFVGGKYLFKNEDDIFHTLQLKLGLEYQKKVSGRPLKDGATIYNLALPIKGLEISKPIKKYHRYTGETGFIQIRSNAHTWIRGYVFVFDHPYAAVTDENGSFSMDGLPEGEYLLKIWHEGFGIQERKIKVKSGEVKELDIEFPEKGNVSVKGGWWTPSVAEAAELTGTASIKLEEVRFDFGTVMEGDVVRHEFSFVNEGKGLLKITDLIPA